MENFFRINYEFDREAVHRRIAECTGRDSSDYICVADGVIMNTANRHKDYLEVVNGGMFSICDSSYVPLYIKWIYGRNYMQYSGSEIFMDIIASRKYRMIFLGTQQHILDGLKRNLKRINPDVETMQFVELPFRDVPDFDYQGIAEMIEKDGADIVWIALGAPKQELFMASLKPYLRHGVMIAVGAAFKFFSGVEARRAPEWMVRNHLEFVYRLFVEPKKQFKRCSMIVITLPSLLIQEFIRKNKNRRHHNSPLTT